mgnify:FL=1
MTAITAARPTSTRIRPLTLLPLVLAILVFAVYQFAPFVYQPELGATSIPVLTASRANNELELPVNGLILIPIAAGALVLMGVWNLVNEQIMRATAAMTALAGIIILEYFVIFVMDYIN